MLKFISFIMFSLYLTSAFSEQNFEQNTAQKELIDYIRMCITDAQAIAESGKKYPEECRVKNINLPMPDELDYVQFLSTGNSAVTPVARLKDGKLVILDGNHLLEISSNENYSNPTKSKNAPKIAMARVSCSSGLNYTVCSDGGYGCVWSNRSGNLLGCGRGI